MDIFARPPGARPTARERLVDARVALGALDVREVGERLGDDARDFWRGSSEP